jgi:hypothetical protein
MSLIGRTLIGLTLILTAVVALGTVRLWRLPGRWRLPARMAGLVTVQILVVTSAGLIVNRVEGFYPSWQALIGDDTVATTAPAPTGRLDAGLAAGPAISWSPPEATRWRLQGPPTVVVPAAYHRYPDRTFPVIAVLTSADRAATPRTRAESAADVLTVIVVPTHTTTATDLGTLPGRLQADLRAAGTGWAIVADTPYAALARQWQALAPAQFRSVNGTFDDALQALPVPLRAPVRLP